MSRSAENGVRATATLARTARAFLRRHAPCSALLLSGCFYLAPVRGTNAPEIINPTRSVTDLLLLDGETRRVPVLATDVDPDDELGFDWDPPIFPGAWSQVPTQPQGGDPPRWISGIDVTGDPRLDDTVINCVVYDLDSNIVELQWRVTVR